MSKKPLRSSKGPRPEDYQIVIEWSDEDSCFLVRLPAWQDVRTHGATLEEAARNAREVLAMLIESAIAKRETLPPTQHPASGKLSLRLPRSLHARLAAQAAVEGVSLNQWIVTKLATT